MTATVLFACVHNAGRSQMAAALFDALADPARARARSAGTEPAPRVHPQVVAAMREIGIDLAAATPALLTDALAREADLLVTMGCGEACPLIASARRVDWSLPDPAGLPLAEVRAIRDAISEKVERLVAENGWRARPSRAPTR